MCRVLFYLLRRKLFDDVTGKMLYEPQACSACRISSDMRVLQESTDARAATAMEYFVYAMTKYAGAYASVLGGLDASYSRRIASTPPGALGTMR